MSWHGLPRAMKKCLATSWSSGTLDHGLLKILPASNTEHMRAAPIRMTANASHLVSVLRPNVHSTKNFKNRLQNHKTSPLSNHLVQLVIDYLIQFPRRNMLLQVSFITLDELKLTLLRYPMH